MGCRHRWGVRTESARGKKRKHPITVLVCVHCGRRLVQTYANPTYDKKNPLCQVERRAAAARLRIT